MFDTTKVAKILAATAPIPSTVEAVELLIKQIREDGVDEERTGRLYWHIVQALAAFGAVEYDSTLYGFIYSYRAYSLSASKLLQSLMQVAPDASNFIVPGLPVRATCKHSHPVPDKDCTCGIYSRAAAPPDYSGLLVKVAIWGKVLSFTEGWRSAYAYPVKIVGINCEKCQAPLAESTLVSWNRMMRCEDCDAWKLRTDKQLTDEQVEDQLLQSVRLSTAKALAEEMAAVYSTPTWPVTVDWSDRGET